MVLVHGGVQVAGPAQVPGDHGASPADVHAGRAEVAQQRVVAQERRDDPVVPRPLVDRVGEAGVGAQRTAVPVGRRRVPQAALQGAQQQRERGLTVGDQRRQRAGRLEQRGGPVVAERGVHRVATEPADQVVPVGLGDGVARQRARQPAVGPAHVSPSLGG